MPSLWASLLAASIVGYNYGAGHLHRVKQIYRTMLVAEIVIGAVATVCFELFPVQIIRLFGSEGDLYNQFAAMSFRIFLSMMLLCCVQNPPVFSSRHWENRSCP